MSERGDDMLHAAGVLQAVAHDGGVQRPHANRRLHLQLHRQRVQMLKLNKAQGLTRKKAMKKDQKMKIPISPTAGLR